MQRIAVLTPVLFAVPDPCALDATGTGDAIWAQAVGVNPDGSGGDPEAGEATLAVKETDGVIEEA